MRTPRFAVGAVAVGLVVSCAALFGIGMAQGWTQASPSLIAWAARAGKVDGVDGYMKAHLEAGVSKFWQPVLFDLDVDPVTYPGERNLLEIRRQDRRQAPLQEDKAAWEGVCASDFLSL